MEERVVLVDARDNELGTASKEQVHVDGRLHRAFSVFLFNSSGQTLLQRRAADKYHSAGLWSNTCCSHPRPGEKPHAAALRRLDEEMGVATELAHLFAFIYRAELPGGLVEHELDHVFIGRSDSNPAPNAEEVMAWRWVDPDELLAEVEQRPEEFTAWLPIALSELLRRNDTVQRTLSVLSHRG